MENQFFYDGWSGHLDVGVLIGDHLEPGIRFAAQSLNSYWFDGFGDGLETLEILPYVRYYFLKNPKIRPYFVGALGVSWSWLKYGFYELENGRFAALKFDPDLLLGARAGFGLRILRFLDFAVTYAYSGSIRRLNFSSPPKFPLVGIQNKYHLHFMQIALGFSIGGHMKPRYKEQKRVETNDFED